MGLTPLRVVRRIVMLVALVSVAALFPGTALAADRWSDISDEQWVSSYGVSAEQVWTVASGYDDGTFRPYQAVTRAQLAKMAVNGFMLDATVPPSPTFDDVPASHPLYAYVEGAFAAGIVGGYGNGEFGPDDPITRQQANSILGRFLSDAELRAMSVIWGLQRGYPSLQAWYQGEADFWLGVFSDLARLDGVHKPATGYLVYHDVVSGSQVGGQFFLSPLASLSRAQAVVMVLRTYRALDEVAPGPPAAPMSLVTYPLGPSAENRPTVSGRTLAGGLVTLYDTFVGKTLAVASVYADETTGDFSLRIPAEAPLAEGRHQLTARVRNKRMLWSESSAPVEYVVDAGPPEVVITTPGEGSALSDPAPVFRANATDAISAITAVGFQYAPDEPAATFHQIAVDASAPFRADWGALALPDGMYILRATAEDEAGNRGQAADVRIAIDTAAPWAGIIQPEDPGTGDPLLTTQPTPDFAVLAYDLPSPVTSFTGNIARVTFFFAPSSSVGEQPGPEQFTVLSSDETVSEDGLYHAEWGQVTLGDGPWTLAAQAVDEAGNVSPLVLRRVVIETQEVS